MCGKIDCYIKAFSSLQTDRDKLRWYTATTFRAPHKPLLLLSILDLITEGCITREFIEPTFELAETFNSYWKRIMPSVSGCNMAMPFYQMDREPFWKLAPRSGVTPLSGKSVSYMKDIRELYLGAKLDPELFKLSIMEPLRKRLQITLINTYFSPEAQFLLFEQSQVNVQAQRYCNAILQTAEPKEQFSIPDKSKTTARKIKNMGFRKAILGIYDHRCALCSVRMLTPDGHSVVQSAHIIPWLVTKDDRPTNGLALCRSCHWAFDEGMMGIDKDYKVLISNQTGKEPNLPGHMLALANKPIVRPSKSAYWPGQGNIEWHRREVFKG